jgi:hypothetical protein
MMKRIAARLAGDEIGLPETERDRLSAGCPAALKTKTAVPAATRRGDRKMPHEAIAKLCYEQCCEAPCLTSVGLAACFSDEGYFFEWEVAR